MITAELPTDRNASAGAKAFVSVVVCTQNRVDSLRVALESLLKLRTTQEFEFEILVIDNASTDETPAVVQEFSDRDGAATVRYVFEPNPGVAYARNRGVREAVGPWIAFFDDDQEADPRWLEMLVHIANSKRSICVGGQVQLRLPPGFERNLGPVCRDLLSETVGQPEVRQYTRRFKPGAGNLLLHRLAIDHVDGFSLDYNDRGEDTILFLKIFQAGYEAWYTPEAIVYHCIPADRLTDDAFLELAKIVGSRLPAFEKDKWRWLFPAAWMARIVLTTVVTVPKWIWARCVGDPDQRLEAHCNLVISVTRIWHGAQWLFAGNPLLTS